jgi:anti-anti-sigma regulatory factor
MSTATTGDQGPAYYVVGTSEIHERSVFAFREEVDAAVDRYLAEDDLGSLGPLVFDLGWVTFLDAVGVQVLVEATDRAQATGGAVRFRNAAGAIRLVLEGAGRWDVHGPKPASQPSLTVTKVIKSTQPPARPPSGGSPPARRPPKGLKAPGRKPRRKP